MSEEKRVIPKEKFRIVGKDLEKMESISRPHLTFAQEVWRRMKKNKAAYVSPVSYTHLDVYKRQVYDGRLLCAQADG